MQPIAPHIEHLSQLLYNHVQARSSRTPAQTDIDGFFQSIATDRIRFNGHDWQGLPVTTMLWHMPNLKPEKQTALVAYISRQWDIYTDGTVEPAGDEAACASLPTPSATPTQSAVDEGPVETVNRTMDGSSNSQDHFFSTFSAPRRDWFDRFTDWVAAVISLFG